MTSTNDITEVLASAAIESEDRTDRFSADELTQIASLADAVTAAWRREIEEKKAVKASTPTNNIRRPGRRSNFRF
jgi:hypothetical protein